MSPWFLSPNLRPLITALASQERSLQTDTGTSAREQPQGSTPQVPRGSAPLTPVNLYWLYLRCRDHIPDPISLWFSSIKKPRDGRKGEEDCVWFPLCSQGYPPCALSLPLFPHPPAEGERRWHNNISCLKPGICILYRLSQ